jgi:hypothetical protein
MTVEDPCWSSRGSENGSRGVLIFTFFGIIIAQLWIPFKGTC